MSTDKITVPMIFFQRLGEARLKKGLRKSELARIIGVSPQVYQRYEEGRLPSADKILKIASAVDCAVDWLLGRDAAPGSVAEGSATPSPIPSSSSSAAIAPAACRIPAECDLPAQLEAVKAKLVNQERQLDEIRKLLISLLAEGRSNSSSD